MKLRSKLIATIVSMCAAIAVMGVGVWASISDNFTITVKNDVDVQILRVDADVWGEYAVYTNMKDATAVGRSTTMANRALGTATDATTYTNDTRYVLYTHFAGGYNDGIATVHDDDNHAETPTHPEATAANTTAAWDAYTGIADSGLGNYLTGANNAYLDSGVTDHNIVHRDINVDSATTAAQVVFMYTVRQYESGTAGLNNILFTLTDNITAEFAGKLGTSSETEFNANYYVASTAPGDAVTGTAWTDVTPADNGTSYFVSTSNAAGATAGDNDKIINIMCVYTLVRGTANIDLSGLYDAFAHTLAMDSAGTTATTAVDSEVNGHTLTHEIGGAGVALTFNSAATTTEIISETEKADFARITTAPTAAATTSIFGGLTVDPTLRTPVISGTGIPTRNAAWA